jgi:enamine deaminase RidA (YjgF/YER057c/UK114 family)
MIPRHPRRRFLENCGLIASGAAAGVFVPAWLQSPHAAPAQDTPAHRAEEQLKRLGLELPPTSPPRNTLVPSVRVGELLFVSGHGPQRADGSRVVGKVGRDLDVEAAQLAARSVGLQILAIVREAVGSLDQIVRVVRTLGMVNATPDFEQHPQVINGCSNLMVEV